MMAVQNFHLFNTVSVGKTLVGYKRGRPLPVLPRMRSRLLSGTQEVPRGGIMYTGP